MRRIVVVALLFVSVVAVRVWTHANGMRRIAAAPALLDDRVTRAVVLGDSVARGAGDEHGLGIAGWLDRELRGLDAAPVVNLGVNGARTFHVRGLLARDATRRAVRAADLIIISIGGNDLYGDSPARLLSALVPKLQQERVLDRVDRLVGRVRRLNPSARIYLLGLYNPYRRLASGPWLDKQVNLWDSRLIARFAAARGVTMIRICDLLDRDDRISRLDGFHPGSTGYAAIAARIAASLSVGPRAAARPAPSV